MMQGPPLRVQDGSIGRSIREVGPELYFEEQAATRRKRRKGEGSRDEHVAGANSRWEAGLLVWPQGREAGGETGRQGQDFEGY